jgi:Domain of unknown function (DUF4400)
MIRLVTAGGLLAFLALVVYLPAAYAPEAFLHRVRVEHDLNVRVLGPEPARQILDRMQFLRGQSASANPIPSTFLDNPGPPPVDVAMARHVSAASARLLESGYVKSMDALLVLSLYRVSSLAEWLPMLFVFLVVVIIDGLIRRVVKSKEFLRHNPELFAAHLCLAIVTCCVLALAFVTPIAIHPHALAAAPMLAGLSVSQAIANFHARG